MPGHWTTVHRRKRKRITGIERQSKGIATAPNVSWSMDLVADWFVNGRGSRCLNIVDDFTKECLTIDVDTSLPGKRIVSVLERPTECRGLSTSVTVDNGPECISKVLDEWADRKQLQLRCIVPGKPQPSAYIESFHGKFRDERMDEDGFSSLQHAWQVFTARREECNPERPHSALGTLTPNGFADSF